MLSPAPGPSSAAGGPPPRSKWSRFKDGFRTFVAWVFSNVGICVLVVGYLLLGAVCFQQIEGPEELKISFRYEVEYPQNTLFGSEEKIFLSTEVF